MAKIVVEHPRGGQRVVKDSPFDLERVLRENIMRLPDLIPIEEATGEPVKLLPIGIEVRVPTGAVDLLILDSAGVVTIVETKLARNLESRREVIRQVLEYAAYISEWGIDEIERQAEKFFRSDEAEEEYRDLTFDAALTKFLHPPDGDTDALDNYLDKLAQNLREGRLRLIVATDRLVETARKTITFVNTFSTFDIYLLQVSCYQDEDGTRVYAPSLYGYARKVSTPSPRKPWTWERYQAELGWSADIIQRAQSLVSRLERVAQAWKPEILFRKDDIWVACSGNAAFGVTNNFRRMGLSLWFELDQGTEKAPPKGVILTQKQLQGENYLYLSGSVEKLSDDQLKRLCEAALKYAEVEPGS